MLYSKSLKNSKRKCPSKIKVKMMNFHNVSQIPEPVEVPWLKLCWKAKNSNYFPRVEWIYDSWKSFSVTRARITIRLWQVQVHEWRSFVQISFEMNTELNIVHFSSLQLFTSSPGTGFCFPRAFITVLQSKHQGHAACKLHISSHFCHNDDMIVITFSHKNKQKMV